MDRRTKNRSYNDSVGSLGYRTLKNNSLCKNGNFGTFGDFVLNHFSSDSPTNSMVISDFLPDIKKNFETDFE